MTQIIADGLLEFAAELPKQQVSAALDYRSQEALDGWMTALNDESDVLQRQWQLQLGLVAYGKYQLHDPTPALRPAFFPIARKLIIRYAAIDSDQRQPLLDDNIFNSNHFKHRARINREIFGNVKSDEPFPDNNVVPAAIGLGIWTVKLT